MKRVLPSALSWIDPRAESLRPAAFRGRQLLGEQFVPADGQPLNRLPPVK